MIIVSLILSFVVEGIWDKIKFDGSCVTLKGVNVVEIRRTIMQFVYVQKRFECLCCFY